MKTTHIAELATMAMDFSILARNAANDAKMANLLIWELSSGAPSAVDSSTLADLGAAAKARGFQKLARYLLRRAKREES